MFFGVALALLVHRILIYVRFRLLVSSVREKTPMRSPSSVSVLFDVD